MGTSGFKTALAGAAFLLLSLGLVYSLVAWGAYVSVLPETQYLDSTMLIQDEEGAPVGGARVVVFELADGGPRKLSEGVADNLGVYRTSLKLPRKLVWAKPAAMLEEDAAMVGFEKSEVYAAVNLWVVASKVGEESGNQVVDVGTLTLSVDPTFMSHPLDSATHILKLSRIKPQASVTSNTEGSTSLVGLSPQRVAISSCQIPTYPYQEESWAYTKVLQFATWDNIQAKYNYLYGSKIRVESKERYFVVATCSYTPWSSVSSTVVTLDSGIESDWLTGRQVYTLKFEFKYYFVRYWPEGAVLIEKVYAADTSGDPRATTRGTSSWSGSLPSWSYYYITNQLETRSIPITGTGSGYSFSVGVSVGFKGVGVGISLGVSKQPSPVSYLYIKAGTWTSGYKVETVSRDGTYLETYSNWVPP